MLYWIKVYAVVIGALMAPFLLLYGVVVLSSLGQRVAGLMIRYLKRLRGLRAGLSRHHEPPLRPV